MFIESCVKISGKHERVFCLSLFLVPHERTFVEPSEERLVRPVPTGDGPSSRSTCDCSTGWRNPSDSNRARRVEPDGMAPAREVERCRVVVDCSMHETLSL